MAVHYEDLCAGAQTLGRTSHKIESPYHAIESMAIERNTSMELLLGYQLSILLIKDQRDTLQPFIEVGAMIFDNNGTCHLSVTMALEAKQEKAAVNLLNTFSKVSE